MTVGCLASPSLVLLLSLDAMVIHSGDTRGIPAEDTHWLISARNVAIVFVVVNLFSFRKHFMMYLILISNS